MSRRNQDDKRRRNRVHRPLRNRDPSLVANGTGIPVGAIVANYAEQAPNNSYWPRPYYADQDITCVDCGAVETWTAEQQHWWYEEAKGPVDSTAVRCRSCREAARAEKERQRARSDEGRRSKNEGRGKPGG